MLIVSGVFDEFESPELFLFLIKNVVPSNDLLWLIAFKIKVFVYIIYVRLLCLFIMCI